MRIGGWVSPGRKMVDEPHAFLKDESTSELKVESDVALQIYNSIKIMLRWK